jgi:predicted nucleic acid-binding Zn ribbon protein
MTYTYRCESCNEQWEDRQLLNDRDLPTTQACCHCNSEGTVKRIIDFAPRISYDGAKTVLQRAGSGWNDVLTKVKKNSGRYSNIETR